MTRKHYALFGQPIGQSLSPRIHAAFAHQSGVAMDYSAQDCGAAEFSQRLAAFAENGGAGANITQPLKSLAFAYAETIGASAQRAGVINTLTRRGDAWHGDNTDGAGLMHDLTERLGLDLRGRRTLMLGAGGAAAGVLPALLDAGVESVTLVNRTSQRAEQLCERHDDPRRVHARYWKDLATLGVFDFVLDATSAGHGGNALELPFAITGARTLAVSLSYGAAASRFLAWARAAGCSDVHDGLGMLIEQAAESFEIWHGVRPDTLPLHRDLHADRSEAALLATD
ncbi:MAG: shikimate dehydrogenase [Lysobacterales bacterium]